LRSGSLLTGQLYVAFEYFPKSPRVKVNWAADRVELPVVPSTLPHLEQRITSIMAKIDAMPLEAIGSELKNSMVSLNLLLKDTDRAVKRIDAELTPELKKTLEDFRRATVSADKMISNADTTLLGPDAPGQQDLREAMREVARAARSLRVLTDYLERHPEALIRGKN
jgi:paraquat-inducible protein B